MLVPPTPHVRIRMQTQRRKDTDPELRIRRELWAMGMRYRVGMKVPGHPRRTIDIAFPRARVAIFVDGCFWHMCPEHSVPVKNNSSWWAHKLLGNVERDGSTNTALETSGWTVLRFWEHEDPVSVALMIKGVVRSRQ